MKIILAAELMKCGLEGLLSHNFKEMFGKMC
jgi:hypothetical protein